MAFWRKQKQEQISLEQREVKALDDWIAALPAEQQQAFGSLIVGLMPSLVNQMQQHSALPMMELGERIKEGGKRLLFRLANPQACFERIGAAFLTHAPTIRSIASAAAQSCVEQQRQLEAIAEKKIIDVTPTPPALEPVR